MRRPIGIGPDTAAAIAGGRRNSFGGVSAAVESLEPERKTVLLGQVWAAIPDLLDPLPQVARLDPAWSRPLRAYFPVPEPNSTGEVVPLPRDLGLLIDGLRTAANDADAMLGELKAYPSVGESGP
jgi:hypothetical protein